MPPTRPSDEHSSHDGEWWKKDKTDRERNNVDPGFEEHIDAAERNDEAFEESQLPVQTPT